MSDLEQSLEFQLKAVKIGGYEREYRFHPERKWRFDFAWPHVKLAVEVDGGLYSQGRHSRGPGQEKDNEKFNEAENLGWSVRRFGPQAIKSGQAIGVIETALASRSNSRSSA